MMEARVMEALKLEHDLGLMRRSLLLFAETVLRPLVRILLRHGLSYAEFNQVARKLFVDTAMNEAEFRLPRRRKQYKARGVADGTVPQGSVPAAGDAASIR